MSEKIKIGHTLYQLTVTRDMMERYYEYASTSGGPLNFENWIQYRAFALPVQTTREPESDKKPALPVRRFSQSAWTDLLTSSIGAIQALSSLKGGEYAGDSDRLANFRRNAAQTGTSMELVWSIYYNKHHDALMQFIRDLQQGKERTRAEPLSGRVDDMIVYLLLFKAMLLERGEK